MPDTGQLAPLEPPAAAAAAEWPRIRAAALDIVFEHGPAAATVDAICDRAAISPARFDELFRDRGDCLLAVYEANVAALEAHVFAAYNSHPRWREGMRASAYAAARWMRDHPRELGFGPAVRAEEGAELVEVRYERMLERVVDLVDCGRQELADPDSLGRSAAQGVLGAISHYIAKEVQAPGFNDIEEMVPQMLYFAVRIYLGPEAAAKELEILPPPEGPEHA